jgi:hypothetical protein
LASCEVIFSSPWSIVQFKTVLWQQESNTKTFAKTWLQNLIMMAINWRRVNNIWQSGEVFGELWGMGAVDGALGITVLVSETN